MRLKKISIRKYFSGRKFQRNPYQKTLKARLYSKIFEMITPEIKDAIPFLIGLGILTGLIAFILPLHPNFLMILGLCIDIIGAFLIVSPILNEYNKFKIKEFKKKYSFPEKSKFEPDDNTSIRNNQNRGRLGVSVLILGFVFQILGNILQWINS